MMTLSEAAKAIDATWAGQYEDLHQGESQHQDQLSRSFESVGTDSRHIVKNQLFVALKGDKFDGHVFVEQALADGAAAVMVNEDAAKQYSANTLKFAIIVKDTYLGLGRLAAYWRSTLKQPMVAVTGSSGKTTVKEMLATILRTATHDASKVLATEGNLNNHIGLPLTLLKLQPRHVFSVIEMGMNHTGEIAYLTRLAKPDAVIINNAGNAHLGELGSYEAIAKAKGEILEGLSETGTAILNADDPFFTLWKGLAKGKKILTFGLKATMDKTAGDSALNDSAASHVTATYQLHEGFSDIDLNTFQGSIQVKLPVPGLHNVMNALAATAGALAVNVSLNNIKNGLALYQGAKGRLQSLYGFNGACVIDDTYNANPMSMKVAIDVLAARAGHKLLVLGDMGELGEEAIAMHQDIGNYAKNAQLDALYTFGSLSAYMTKAYGQGAKHFETLDALISALKNAMQANTTVLVKASRFMAMERVVNQLLADEG